MAKRNIAPKQNTNRKEAQEMITYLNNNRVNRKAETELLRKLYLANNKKYTKLIQLLEQRLTVEKGTIKNNIEYKLTYQEHSILKQAAFKIMKHHNNKEYESEKPHNQKRFLKYNQTISILYKTKSKEQLLDIIHRYQKSQEKQDNKQQIDYNTKSIIIDKLKEVTDEQLNILIVKLQELESKYYLQLDTDYSDKYSVLRSYQQVLGYKTAGIELQPRPTEEELVGNMELLDSMNYNS